MANDPDQTEVDAVYCAIYHAWDPNDLEKAARAAIATLDHVRAERPDDFVIEAWGIYTGQKLLITTDSRESAEDLLDPDETLVRVTARCTRVERAAKENP